jgi:glycosyltransferase involved in cell wall biosynthesis
MNISVTLPFHNELEFLPKWYESAKKYADQIIMAAHAPTDGSLEWALQKQKDNEIPIEIIEFPEETIYQYGFSYMKNRCIAKATGDWIVCLDADEEMEMTKDKLEPWTHGGALAVSTVTMHTSDRNESWSLSERIKMIREANWIRQRHWRIFRNHHGVSWQGLIHEELRRENIHVGRWSRNSTIPMWHFGSMANPAKRTFKDGLYAELLLRLVEQPDTRAGTNSWWYTTYFEENKETLYKQREEYRADRAAKGLVV